MTFSLVPHHQYCLPDDSPQRMLVQTSDAGTRISQCSHAIICRSSKDNRRAHSQFVDAPRRSASPVTSSIALHHTTTHNQTALPLHSSDPEGSFRGNQLLGRSMSLSPQCTTLTNDLHVSMETGFHHSFPWLHHGSA